VKKWKLGENGRLRLTNCKTFANNIRRIKVFVDKGGTVKLLVKHFLFDKSEGIVLRYSYSVPIENIEDCGHNWSELGMSSSNGKLYKRCSRCGLVQEHIFSYVV
jgi:hypothetical protein